MVTRDTFDRFAPPERGLFGDNEAAAPIDGGVEIALVHHVDADRPSAVLLSINGDRARALWLPRSQISMEELGPPERRLRGKINQPVRVTLPQWLARAKGLI